MKTYKFNFSKEYNNFYTVVRFAQKNSLLYEHNYFLVICDSERNVWKFKTINDVVRVILALVCKSSL